MKKPILIFILVSIMSITYVFFFTQIGDRLARYHNHINVFVSIDGIQHNMEGTKINYLFETGRIFETGTFRDYNKNKRTYKQVNSVKFKKGSYAGNIFEFIIHTTYLQGFEADIELSFSYSKI